MFDVRVYWSIQIPLSLTRMHRWISLLHITRFSLGAYLGFWGSDRETSCLVNITNYLCQVHGSKYSLQIFLPSGSRFRSRHSVFQNVIYAVLVLVWSVHPTIAQTSSD